MLLTESAAPLMGALVQPPIAATVIASASKLHDDFMAFLFIGIYALF
jgi:hypothetical protein